MKKLDVLSIKHSRIIEDPFPEWTMQETLRVGDMVEKIIDLLGLERKQEGRVSIWKAYRMGYEKAYGEILERCTE